MKSITAAVARNAGEEFTIEPLTLDDPRPDEVLVKIVGVGICHSDLAAKDQHLPVALPAVLGHEGAGIIEKVGSAVTDLTPGDHVVLSFSSCGHCGSCENDHPSYCDQFFPLNFMCTREDGSTALKSAETPISSHFFGQSSFATYAVAKRSNAIKVRKDAPLKLLGPLGCGVITGAGSIMKAMACEAGSRVVIAGGGAVGLSAVLGAVVQQCSTIIVVEPHASRRELALSLGATHVIDPFQTENLAEALRAIVPEGLNYAFDTTSLQAVMDGIVPTMSQGGTIGLVGVPHPDAPRLSFDVITLLTFGVKVMGITEGDVNPVTFIPELIDLHMENRFTFDKLCKTYAFEDINTAVEDQAKGECVKAVLTF